MNVIKVLSQYSSTFTSFCYDKTQKYWPYLFWQDSKTLSLNI